jgi:hypothetical protein
VSGIAEVWVYDGSDWYNSSHHDFVDYPYYIYGFVPTGVTITIAIMPKTPERCICTLSLVSVLWWIRELVEITLH